MRSFSNNITLSRNSRGLRYIDPLLGCSHGKLNNGKGCYGVCYASNSLKCRGYDFDSPVKRYFADDESYFNIANKIMWLPFIRMGVNCDPSDDWEHTISIVKKLKPFNKNIVIVTKHWNKLSVNQEKALSGLFVNTSISALDSKDEIEHRLYWHNRLKKTCHSILRVNSVNSCNEKIMDIQKKLFDNDNVIDNVLRFRSKAVENLILEKVRFLKGNCYVSRANKNAYLGDCYNCPDLCGVKMHKKVKLLKPAKQTTLFDMESK